MQIFRTTFTVILFILIGLSSVFASLQSQKDAIGYIDQNLDGVNDLFTDVNGDGINDRSGQPYPYHFKYEDKDGDAINDFWIDSDGDGVNDRLGEILKKMSRWIDRDGDGIGDEKVGQLSGRELRKHVLDVDDDGHNDVTGIPYSDRDLYGYRYGNIDEETGIKDSHFIDENSDGMNDHFAGRKHIQGQGRQKMDLFIDVDGDGIADDRGLHRMRRRGGKKGKK